MYFSADWCGPCEVQKEIVKDLAEDNEDLVIDKIDIDEHSDVANEYEVRSIPTLILGYENDGDFEQESRFIGVTQKEDIEAKMEQL